MRSWIRSSSSSRLPLSFPSFPWAWLVLRAYRNFRGTRVVTCPETRRPVAVELDAKHAAVTGVTGEADLRLQACSRWPERQDCGQECLAADRGGSGRAAWSGEADQLVQGRTRCALCGRDHRSDPAGADHKPGLISSRTATDRLDRSPRNPPAGPPDPQPRLLELPHRRVLPCRFIRISS